MLGDLPTPTRESADRINVPPRPVREIAREAVRDIDHAISVLYKWGVKIPDASRLHSAREILQQAAQTSVLVPKHRGDHLGLRALELALDFAAIAGTLPSTPLAALRRDLRDSLIGDIDPPEAARGPLQLQSQAIVRAAFVRAGLVPEHPTHSSQRGMSSPDLILESGTLRYAIEAKRPQLRKNVTSRFDEACAQLASYGLSGGVMIDVTDCLRGAPQSELDREVRAIALGLYDRVSGSGHRAGYSHIMTAGAYARVGWTSDDGEENAMVNVHTSSTIGIFATAPNTLVDLRAKWIRSHFENGLTHLNRTLAEPRPSVKSGNI